MLKLYNTLTRKKEVFKPIKKGRVSLYTCGPTVYNYIHLGNLRAFLFYDLVKRYLLYKKYKVKHVMNITDVDDKTIRDSQKEKKSLKEFTEFYTKEFLRDLQELNIINPDIMPKATEHIPEMVSLVKILLKKGYAYKAADGIYFSIKKFKNYGNLAQLEKQNLQSNARVSLDEYEKENISDFSLWKAYDKNDGNVFWEREIGKGRPGWHLECSAMSQKYLGIPFDIHCGGIDLVFPHHTNEIAQSEAAYNKKFVNYWLHNEHLLVDEKKMSKSLHNFYTLRDLLSKQYSGKEIRFLLLSVHYRQKINFTFESLNSVKNILEKIEEFMTNIQNYKKSSPSLIKKTKQEFEKAMDDDLNFSKALAVIFDFMKEVNKKRIGTGVKKLMLEFDKVLGLNLDKIKSEKIPEKIIKLAAEREKARKEKNYKEADKIRNEINSLGYQLEDSGKGVKIKKV